MSKGASALREGWPRRNSASTTAFKRDQTPGPQDATKAALEGLHLGSDFRIVKFLQNENHGDLYSVQGLGFNGKSYVAKAIDFAGCAPKLRAHRQKHLKRLKASSSFACVVEEHGLKWVIRDFEESRAADASIIPQPEFAEPTRSRSDGSCSPGRDLVSEQHVDTGVGRDKDGSKLDIDSPPDGDCDEDWVPESYVTRVESEPRLGSDDNVADDDKEEGEEEEEEDQERPRPVESTDDSSLEASGDLAGDGADSSAEHTSRQQKREARKQAAKVRWRKIQRQHRRTNRLDEIAASLSAIPQQPRTAPIQVLIPESQVQADAEAPDTSDTRYSRPENPLCLVLGEHRRRKRQLHYSWLEGYSWKCARGLLEYGHVHMLWLQWRMRRGKISVQKNVLPDPGVGNCSICKLRRSIPA